MRTTKKRRNDFDTNGKLITLKESEKVKILKSIKKKKSHNLEKEKALIVLLL